VAITADGPVVLTEPDGGASGFTALRAGQAGPARLQAAAAPAGPGS
jgi:hypothetical protein